MKGQHLAKVSGWAQELGVYIYSTYLFTSLLIHLFIYLFIYLFMFYMFKTYIYNRYSRLHDAACSELAIISCRVQHNITRFCICLVLDIFHKVVPHS